MLKNKEPLPTEPRLRRTFIIVVGVLLAWFFWPLDGVSGWFFAALADEDDTEYAKAYSDWGFRTTFVGMAAESVRERLGPPLEEYRYEDFVGWRHARPRRDGSYRVRVVLLRDGRVAEVHHEFHLD